jgi:hypothetical protein
VRDRLGRQAAHLAERQGDLRIGWQRRMAAREEHPQPVVDHGLGSWIADDVRDVGRRLIEAGRELAQRGVEAGTPPQAVDRPKATGRDQPRPRAGRDAGARPCLGRGDEGILEGLLGEVEVPEEPDERREDATRFRPVELVEPPLDRRVRARRRP